MEISIVSSVFVNYSLEDTASYLVETGCAGIDIWAGRPHVYRRDYSKAQLQHLRRKLEDSQLKIVSLMPAFYRYPHSLSSPNDIVRQDSLDHMRECLTAVILGADILLIVPSRRLHGQSVEDARHRLTDSIDTVCRQAADYPIRLGIEPANLAVTDLVLSSDDARDIMNTLGHEKLGVVLDSGHLNLTGERLEDAIMKLGSALLQFHVNDNDGKRQQNLVPERTSFQT
jgi:sugar phosphate isomerase/epimerase